MEPTPVRSVAINATPPVDPVASEIFPRQFVRCLILCIGGLCLLGSVGSVLTFLYYLCFDPFMFGRTAAWYMTLNVVRELCAVAAGALIVRGSLPNNGMKRSSKWVTIGAAILLANALLSLVLTWTMAFSGVQPVNGGTWIYLSGPQTVRLVIDMMPIVAVFWLAGEVDGRGRAMAAEGARA